MADKHDLYRAFMLRLWRMAGPGTSWRAALEDAHTGEQRVFADLESLCVFLSAQTGAVGQPGRDAVEPSVAE